MPAAPNHDRRWLPGVPLSHLPRVRDLDALMDSDRDALLVLDERGGAEGAYLDDLGGQVYIAALRDCLVLPWTTLRNAAPSPHPPGVRPAPLMQRHLGHNLVVRGNGTLITDSFKSSYGVDGALPHRDGRWHVPWPDAPRRLETAHYYIDIVSAHFGHALVDTLSRLWPLARPEYAALARLPGIGFSWHDLARDPARWPGFLVQLLEATGMTPERILLPQDPVICRQLIVAKRVSPMNGRTGFPGGPQFNALLARLGDRLLDGAGPAPSGASARLFLSRRQAGTANRALPEATAARLESLFASMGFAVIYPETLPLARQIALVRGASHIAGPLGSQLHLAAFRDRPGLRMLRILPSFFQTDVDPQILRFGGGMCTDVVIPAQLSEGRLPFEGDWDLRPDDWPRLEAAARLWAGLPASSP